MLNTYLISKLLQGRLWKLGRGAGGGEGEESLILIRDLSKASVYVTFKDKGAKK